MPSWYDICGLNFGSLEDEAGLKRAAQSVECLIQREIERGIPSEHILLCGFSQGGALALYTGLRYARPLAGILALSTYLPVAQQLTSEANDLNRNPPIFMAHGEQDTVVSLEMGEWSRDQLRALGYAVGFHHRYAMPHSICTQEVEDMGRWIQQHLPEGFT
jgi:phospholipase/carboxylesterase